MIFILFVGLMWSSCTQQKETKKLTSIEFIDPNRHYYPVIQGEEFEIIIPIKNTGDNFLKITDIQTSCGCVVVDKSAYVPLKAGEEREIRIKNDSKKNIGYVKHYVKLYGNILPAGEAEIVFDYHVVPDALYIPDYEEIYSKSNNFKRIAHRKGYYVDKDSIN